MIITAFHAILLNSDCFVHISSNRVVSRIYNFPALPEGSKKMFFLQWTISSYVALMMSSTSARECDPQTSGWGCWTSTFGWLLTTLLELDVLHLFWCWFLPRSVLKVLGQLSHFQVFRRSHLNELSGWEEDDVVDNDFGRITRSGGTVDGIWVMTVNKDNWSSDGRI